MVFGVAERDARADRKEPVVAFARDIVGADFADPSLVTGEALAPFGADAERRRQIGLREAAGLDREADLGQVGPDVGRLALAAEAESGTKGEIARMDERLAEAFVGRFELKREIGRASWRERVCQYV